MSNKIDRLSVLVVDDERDILDSIVQALKVSGYKVIDFVNPNLALHYFENVSNSCDVMLSDVHMPPINGFQLARIIKERHPKTKIILMSSFEIYNSEFEKVMPNTHVDGFLCKPIEMAKLLAMIRNVMSRELTA